MTYTLYFTLEAETHLAAWKKSGRKKTLNKIATLLEELTLHPTTGTGQVEALKGDFAGLWSRRIDKFNRLIYSIDNDKVIVTIITLMGHYGNK